MDGLNLLRKLKSDELLSRIPVIFLTAKSTYEELREGMTFGADDYLFKPFIISDLLNSVNAVLNKYEKQENRLRELRESIALTVPHEFRTPLTAILGYSEMLKEEINNVRNNDEFEQIINNLSFSVNRINILVQKFTNYANIVTTLNDDDNTRKIRNGAVSTSSRTIELSAILSAGKNGRYEDLRLCVENTRLNYDEHYLSYIIEELTANAMKYSRPGTPIEVTGYYYNEDYLIKVRDSGIGMTLAQINNIDIFNQVSKDAQQKRSGNGIGLITVKNIAAKTGLGFNIASEPEKYTEVTITLKLQKSIFEN